MILVDIMSMPKNCSECLFWRYCHELKTALNYRLGRWEYDMIERSVFRNKRCGDCPLIEIPDNATNGDVINALFSGTQYIGFTKQRYKRNNASFDKDWWNAPYKTEARR